MNHAFALALAILAPAQAPTPTPTVTRVHDVTAASVYAGPGDTPRLSLVPMLAHHNSIEEAHPTGVRERSADLVFELLRGWNVPMWESEGRSFQSIDPTRLLVRAPAADHEALARQIAFLEGTLGRPTRLVVDLATFGPNPGVEGLSAVVPVAEVERWVGLALRHERHELDLLAGEIAGVSSARVVTLLTSYDVQIAERMSIHDPFAENVRVGATIQAAAAPARGGLWLAAILRDGRLIGNIEQRDLALPTSIANEQGVTTFGGPRFREDARLANYSMVVNSFVPDGKALVFQSSIGLETHVVFVHQVGGSTPSLTRLSDDLKRALTEPETVLLRGDGLFPAVASVRVTTGADALRSQDLCEMQPRSNGGALAATIEFEGDFHSIVDAVEPGATLAQHGPWIIPVTGERASAEAYLARYAEMQVEPRALHARVTLRRGTRDASVLSRASLPLRVGATSTLTIGKEQLLLSGLESEIAQGSASRSMSPYRSFDGFVVSITPRGVAQGAVLIDVEGHARWSRELARVFDTGDETMPKLQMQDSDLLDDTGTGVFGKADKGPRRFRLGNQGTTDDALTLEVELVDLE